MKENNKGQSGNQWKRIRETREISNTLRQSIQLIKLIYFLLIRGKRIYKLSISGMREEVLL